MGQKVILAYFYVKLLMVSTLLELAIAGPRRTFEENIRDHFARQKYMVEKLPKSKRGSINYKNPCQTVRNDIKTKNKDQSTSDSVKSSSMYVPETLTEVSCEMNSLNARQRPSCQGFNGDCMDIWKEIKVVRFSDGFPSIVSVSLKVGCACMIPL